MPKILSQAGVSLSDIYDIEGSIVGVEELVSRDVALVHEMGENIFSERLRTTVLRGVSAAIAENTAFDFDIPGRPSDMAIRLASCRLHIPAADAGAIDHVSVNLRTSPAAQEIPFFEWDVNATPLGFGGGEITVRLSDLGGAPADVIELRMLSSYGGPSMIVHNSDPNSVDTITVRGLTAGFGAGTVVITALAYIIAANRDVGTGVSSFGLPIPSW